MILLQALAFILDGQNWVSGPRILYQLGVTLSISAISVLIVVVIATPIGIAIGHTGRGRGVAILLSNVTRALPTLGLLSILIVLIGVNATPVAIVLVLLGIPPMLAGVYAGIESVNRSTIDAARAMGMTEGQIIGRVEIPLAAPLIVGGLRATTLQIVATTTVASAFAFGGFGLYLIKGLNTADYVQMAAGAILVTALCLLIDGLLAVVQRLVAPRGVPRDGADSASPKPRARASRSRATATVSPLQEGMQS
ncbi:MAG: ABC transporter permease [Micrococcales bacterium]|nr:ABC transporter permease [Micrococcales bacterium]